MPLCSEAQIATLKNWHFIPDYEGYLDELLGIASRVYHVVESTKKNPPEPGECEDLLTLALLTSPGFGSLLRGSTSLMPKHYGQFARGMAQYLLDKYWFDIQLL
jgi:hypothetical protein